MAKKQTCFQTPIWSIFQENPNAVPINVCLQSSISYSNNGFQHFQFSEHLEKINNKFRRITTFSNTTYAS